MGMSFRKLESWKKRMHAAWTGRQNIHLLHLRKTGGTALKSVFNQHQVTPSHTIYTHPHRYCLADLPVGHKVMFVTRDPCSRFVSGFASRQRKGAPANHVPWSRGEERAFSVFPNANSLALALDADHSDHGEALQAMAEISHLRSTYWDWFGDRELLERREKDIHFIGRTEELDADFEILRASLGLPMGVALPTDPKTGHRSSPTAKEPVVLEARALALVRDWYAKDYELMDFCADWRERNNGPVAGFSLPEKTSEK